MRYTGNQLKEIRFPVGGIGTGSVSVCGNGLLRDFEIFGRPSKGSAWGFTHFAVRVETASGKVYTRIVCGDETENLSGAFSIASSHSHGYGYGLPSASMNGFTHFRDVVFDGEYPVCTLTFSDPDFPGKVVMTAWNPLIPQDSFNSSLPAAIFHLKYINETAEDVKVLFTFALGCPFASSVNTAYHADGLSALHITNTSVKKDEIGYADLTLMTDGDTFVQRSWFRGGWCDEIVTYMNELAAGVFRDRHYDDERSSIGTLVKTMTAAKGGSAETDFVFAWNVPNAYNYWSPVKDENGKDVTWKHWYATQFDDSIASATYLMKNLQTLWDKTARYREIMYGQTMPEEVIDAAANTLSVLRSSTVMRLEDGSFYGFEGTGPESGSCEGTCTHVWSYAYAMCFLFPDLERSIRDLEYRYQTDENGLMDFRLKLPVGSPMYAFPCFDGQMGSIIKTYREWKLGSGDAWLKGHWDDVKKVLSFAWSGKNPWQWDADGDGVADGRMHHTLDVELFGANGWLEGMYLAALKAAEQMADYLGDTAFRDECAAKFANGYRFMKEHLFNGKYFIQNIDLSDVSVPMHFDEASYPVAMRSCKEFYWNDETKQIKYQIGDGCEIDQLLGLWHGAIVGIGGIFDEAQAKTAAKSIYDNNFKTSMRDHVNPWRLFAINDEPGAVICTYPEGSTQPAIPIPYCQECMNGFEYSLAGTLISLGYLDEGLNIVKGVRSKYAGYNRNPYNEIECGSNYARSMASFALIPLLAGFTFDLPHDTIGFAPKLPGDFGTFFSVGTAWGRFDLTNTSACVTIEAGTLTLSSLGLPLKSKTVQSVIIDGSEVPFTAKGNAVTFARTAITKELTVTFA